MSVPGGTANLEKAVGLDPGRPRGLALSDVIRVVYGVDAGKDKTVDQLKQRLIEYLEAISRFERARGNLSNHQVSLALHGQPPGRRAADEFARAIGARFVREKGSYRLIASAAAPDVRRREVMEAAGLDIQALLRAVNAGAGATPALPADEVPMPLPPASWDWIAHPPDRMSGCLMTLLLSDRRSALLYYGLSSADAPTRSFLATSRDLLVGLSSDSRLGVIATVGRSIKVQDGRVEVPGGAGAVASWESLAGAPVMDASRFILALTGRDDGRLALFYDTVSHLDRPMQAVVLGDGPAPESSRIDRLRRVYRAFALTLDNWDVGTRPFMRVTDDAGQLLLRTRAESTGVLAPPSGGRFWEAVFESGEITSGAPRLANATGDDEALDPAAMIGLVCVSDTVERARRVDTWLFAHRVFARTPPSGRNDALLTLRAFSRFRLLALTLERMGIVDASIYAAAVRHALRLSENTDHERLVTRLALFQGSLALLERARFSRVVTEEDAARLVLSLTSLPLSDSGEYPG